MQIAFRRAAALAALALLGAGPGPRAAAAPPALSAVLSAAVATAAGAERPPAGTWERGVGGQGKVTLRIDGSRIAGAANLTAQGADYALRFEADYHLGRDRLLYGVVTRIENPGAKTGLAAPPEGLLFSCRFHAEGDRLTLRNVRFHGIAGPAGVAAGDLAPALLLTGEYRRKE